MKRKIFEAKNLNVFKKLLRILAEYIKNVPDTGTGRLFDLAVKNGMKILPKDKTALAILDHVLDEDAISESMQKFDLSFCFIKRNKNGKKKRKLNRSKIWEIVSVKRRRKR